LTVVFNSFGKLSLILSLYIQLNSKDCLKNSFFFKFVFELGKVINYQLSKSRPSLKLWVLRSKYLIQTLNIQLQI
jgi:hypothetical protein